MPSSPSRAASHRPSSQRCMAGLAIRSSFIFSTRAPMTGSKRRSQARMSSPFSARTRSGWSGFVAISCSSRSSPSISLVATVSSSPVQRRIEPARSWTIWRMRWSLSASALPAQPIAASSSGLCRPSAIDVLSSRPAIGATCVSRMRAATAPLTMPPSRCGSSASSICATSLDAPARKRPPAASAGSVSQRAIAPATSSARMRRAITLVMRKCSRRNWASWSPIRSLFLGTIAVCGMGRPSGWRNSAVTANQSAMPPTIPASANARTKPQKTSAPGWRSTNARLTRNSAAMARSSPVAISRMRVSPGGGRSTALRRVKAVMP